MRKIFFTMLMCLGISSHAQAAQVKVNWQDPDKYTDIRPTNETRDAFRQRLFAALDGVFSDNAKTLPEGYMLEINVTNLDLAGDTNVIHPHNGHDIRVVKDLYWPRMSLEFSLKNNVGDVVSAGKADLSDINFLFAPQIGSNSTGFEYEERMINNWFKEQQRTNAFHIKN